jgi:RHS repeat-associated protein
VQKASSGTPFKLYWYGVGSDPLSESDASGNISEEYIFMGGQRIAMLTLSSGAVNYYIQDHLGSSRVVTNSSGTVLDDSDFYPFGGERAYSSSSGNNYKFTGKERDTESGLDDFAARFYTSNYGRFISADDSKYMHPADPQSFNLYSYVANNPINAVDPTGHMSQQKMQEMNLPYDSSQMEMEGGGGAAGAGADIGDSDPGPGGTNSGSNTQTYIFQITATFDDGTTITYNKPVEASGPSAAYESATFGMQSGPESGRTAQRAAKAAGNLDGPLADRGVQIALYKLFEDSHFGADHGERAAWLTLNDGKYGVVVWPWDNQYDTTQWKGPMPQGTIGQAHTHQTSGTELPTGRDHDLADGTQGKNYPTMNVYTLHQRGIFEAVPHQTQPMKIMGNGWIDLFKPKK